jgi:glucose-6-phosphate 1-dehydrogenase
LVRDMIQNHVMQLLSLVAMEPPATFDATSVRDEKAKVLRAIRPLGIDRIEEFAVRGQYAGGWVGGKKVPGYRAEPKVSPTSTTETYAAFRFHIDNWRWADVPFYLRSGKRLAKRVSEISIQFRRVPHLLFKGDGADGIEPNVLTVNVQPNEGISLKFCAKLPGATMQIRPVQMEFRYGESFGATPPTAYETLLLDCMLGDATLFNRSDAVELSWELVDPILSYWQEQGPKGLASYQAGSWGPAEADALIERDGRQWHRL